jgi:chromosome segregation protein
LQAAERAVQVWSQGWDGFNDRAQGPSQTAEVQQSRIVYLEQVLTKLQERLQQHQSESESLATDQGESAVEPLQANIDKADHDIHNKEQDIQALQKQLTDSQAAIEQGRQQQDAIRASIQETRGHIASLTALQEGASDDRERIALSDWIETESIQSLGSVYAALEVDTGWEASVEQVLGEALSAQVLSDSDMASLPSVATLPAGAFLVEQGTRKAADLEGTLAAHVKGPAGIVQWLLSIKVAQDLAEARRRCAELAPHESVVTKDGHWLANGWHRRRSSADAAAGIIARQAQLESLQAALAKGNDEAAAVETSLSDLLGARAALEKSLSQTQQGLQQLVNERAEWVSERRAVATKLEQQMQRRNQLQEEINEGGRQYEQEQANLAQARQALSAALDQMELDRAERDKLQKERVTLTEALAQQRESARLSADVLMRSELQCQNLVTQVATLKESLSRMELQRKNLESRETELSDTLPVGQDPDAENKAKLAELLDQRVSAEAELNIQRALVGDIEAKLRQLDKLRLEQDQAVQSLQAEIEGFRLQEAESSVRLESLVNEIEKRDGVPQEIAAALPEEVSESEWQDKVVRAEARINRLGPINLAAIDEHAQASERKQYLDAQNEDLETALETLRAAIRKIDKETRQRFKDTFDQINAGFAELFPRVFGGGTACLEMTGDDLLDTGVAIFARPPGKKNSTIHLLSGGEKAMTAIALVFSIFQLNPAPFCMLDEVDAPLDDANVGRYARMVREMSEKVQFVFITHNKITMEAADQLMGVTMQEPGVSRLVTVDVEEAAQLAAS